MLYCASKDSQEAFSDPFYLFSEIRKLNSQCLKTVRTSRKRMKIGFADYMLEAITKPSAIMHFCDLNIKSNKAGGARVHSQVDMVKL